MGEVVAVLYRDRTMVARRGCNRLESALAAVQRREIAFNAPAPLAYFWRREADAIDIAAVIKARRANGGGSVGEDAGQAYPERRRRARRCQGGLEQTPALDLGGLRLGGARAGQGGARRCGGHHGPACHPLHHRLVSPFSRET
ncbi:hypothetical protein D3C87_1369020 [compost metagenome]